MTKETNNTTTNSIFRLSIQVDLNGLSFCTLNSLEHRVEQLVHYPTAQRIDHPDALLDFIKSLELERLGTGFRDVQIIHSNELSAFVPKAFFNKNTLSDYVKYNTKILANDFIDYDLIATSEMVNVYVPYVNINNYFFDLFGAFEYRHAASILVESLLGDATPFAEPKMYVHIRPFQFEIVVIQQRRVLLYNSYRYQTKEDFIYYILFAAEQLQLNPEAFQLCLLGAVDTDHELYQIAYTYVRHVKTLKPNLKVNTADYDEEEVNRNYVLLNTF